MARLRFRLIPKDETFFALFVKQAVVIEAAASALRELVSSFDDVQGKAGRLKALENEGDEVTHEIIRRLNTVFVTPLDHEDIHRIATTMDNVVDHMEAAADLMFLHKIEAPLPAMAAQVDVICRGAATIREAFATLPKYRKLPQFCIEINRLENDGDRIYRQAIADVSGGDHRATDILKWKDIIDELEAAIDEMENVANVLEAVALKQG